MCLVPRCWLTSLEVRTSTSIMVCAHLSPSSLCPDKRLTMTRSRYINPEARQRSQFRHCPRAATLGIPTRSSELATMEERTLAPHHLNRHGSGWCLGTHDITRFRHHGQTVQHVVQCAQRRPRLGHLRHRYLLLHYQWVGCQVRTAAGHHTWKLDAFH